MSTGFLRSSHLARYLTTLRQQRGLKPGQLAVALGASNVSKVGSLIRAFELGESLSDHWLQKLITELNPDPIELRGCLEQDQAEAAEQLERDRIAWEAWADQPIDPHLTIRYMPAVYGVREVPRAFCNSREQAEDWAADELRRFGAKGFLNWSRRERTWYDQRGVNPERQQVTFEDRHTGAWMQLSGSQQKFLLGSSGELITRRSGLEQPCQTGRDA
jgi:hypothetical protein